MSRKLVAETMFVDGNNEIVSLELNVSGENKTLSISGRNHTEGGCGQISFNPKNKEQESILTVWKAAHLKPVSDEIIERAEELFSLVDERSDNINLDKIKDNPKVVAASKHLGILQSEDNMGVTVYTDSEAQEECKRQLSEITWAFSVDFLKKHITFDPEKIGFEDKEDLLDFLREMQKSGEHDRFEDLLKLCVQDLDKVYDAVIEADGRGHTLNSWDGSEHEVEVNGVTYYIYDN